MCIKIKLNKSSKCRHCVGVLGSNPDSSPVVSQSPININERSVVKGSAGDDGKEERDFISPFTFPSSPSYQYRNSLPQPFLDRSQNNKRRLGTIQWSNKAGATPVGLNSNFPTVRHRSPSRFFCYDNSLPGNLFF